MDTPVSYTHLIDRLFVEVDKAFREGANILVLSDRGVDENHMPIPSLLAVSAVHQHLVKTKKSTSLAIILESGEPREVHHFATLLGYGASAINPYLALETIHELIDSHMLDKDYYAAVDLSLIHISSCLPVHPLTALQTGEHTQQQQCLR